MTSPPPADWSTAWTELTGYVEQACDDGEPLDAAVLLDYMAELKRTAIAPVRAWLDAMRGPQ